MTTLDATDDIKDQQNYAKLYVVAERMEQHELS